MPQPERVFFDWSLPTAISVARWLGHRAAHAMVIVPTQQAGRKLQYALGRHVPPAIVTPAQFLEPRGGDLADPLVAALALTKELAGPATNLYQTLFPAGIPARTFAERLALAESLRSLLEELTENGWTVKEVADHFPLGSLDAARWHDLERIFETANRVLKRAGLVDRERARLAAAEKPFLPSDIQEIVVAGVADLQPLAVRALEHVTVPVTILISGPPEPEAFDLWGRPSASAWIERDPGWRDFDQQVRLAPCLDAADFSGVIDDLEIGLLDHELLPALTESLSARGRTIYDLTGRPLSTHWLTRALGEFAITSAEPTFKRIVDLLRHGAIRAWLASRVVELDLDAAVRAADEIRATHFPATLQAARVWIRRKPPLQAAIDPIERAMAQLRTHPAETARQLTAELAEAFAPQLDAAGVELMKVAREALEDSLERLEVAIRHTPLEPFDWWQTLQAAMASSRLYSPRLPGALDASGWPELPWCDAQRLLLAGMNLGKVPAPLGSELFLGRSTRAMLGLPGAEDRRARDAYFLARILALPISVEVLVGQTDVDGSPLQPSPLLFAGAGASLPRRVERLFSDAAAPRPDPAWKAGWVLDPPVVEMPRVIAVTDFQRYLDCPFTFYLNRVVKMETFEPAADELDAAQFGDLVHASLQGWAEDGNASHSTNPEEIARALDAHISAWVVRNLGRHLSLPLRVQVDSARSRLAAFASWQAEDRRDGWRIRAIEQSFAQILGRPWEVNGWTIMGRVDRLDENEHNGCWRVIDYKTFDIADKPDRKHLRAFRSVDRTWPPDYAKVADTSNWWINLQLPLYRQLLMESGRTEDQTICGYFNLPKTIAETGLQTWNDLDEKLQASAITCARGVLADLDRRRFWPPNRRAAYADFEEFFPPDATRLIDANGAFMRSCAT